jgi:hypothetical protein
MDELIMGQAKLRGSFEDRKKESIVKKEQEKQKRIERNNVLKKEQEERCIELEKNKTIHNPSKTNSSLMTMLACAALSTHIDVVSPPKVTRPKTY